MENSICNNLLILYDMIDTFYIVLIRPLIEQDHVLTCILMWIMTLLTLSIFTLSMLNLANTIFVDKYWGYGIVVKHNFVGEDTDILFFYNAAVNILMPIISHNPDTWYITIMIKGKRDKVPVSKKTYDKYKIGTIVPVSYSISRLWKSLNIIKINPS